MTVLKDNLRDLLVGLIEDFFSKIESGDLKKYHSVMYWPVFKNGAFDDQEKITYVDTKQMIFDCNMESKPYYKNAFDKLQNVISKKLNEQSPQNPKDIASKELQDFLKSYFDAVCSDNKGFKKIDEKKFLDNFKIFEKHLEGELNVHYFFATLLNFNAGFNELDLDNEFHIRKITENEFATISGIGRRSEKIDVDHSLFKIKYVIGKTNEKKSKHQGKIMGEDIQKMFQKTLNALKIFRDGNVQLGGLYFRDSKFWEIKNTFVLRREPRTQPTRVYVLNEDKAVRDFRLFHEKFHSINLTKGGRTFLDTSIKRFSKAIEGGSPEERIVDFMISLESLYASKEPDLTYKISLRVAVLLGFSF